MTEGIAVGIDLGTTNSVVAVPFGSGVEVVENSDGDQKTPSVVSFDRDGVYVGKQAENRAVQYPEETVYSIKRQMGDSEYAVHAPDGSSYSPEEVSAMILRKLKGDTERVLGSEVTNAVITVPAYFGNEEREATKHAGEIAGLTVDRIINEPTAACVAYGYDGADDKTVLLYDLGGGTFDVSLVEISAGIVEVKASDGDSFLGGEDWDARILDLLLDEIERDTGWDPETEPPVMQRLWNAAQQAKHQLSSAQQATIQLPFLTELNGDSYNFETTISRTEFEFETTDLVDRTIDICDDLLASAQYNMAEVDEVLLVGGSTRMPQVSSAIETFFGREPTKNIKTDMAVAIGAAKQAGTINPKGLPPGNQEGAQGLTRIADGPDDDILLVDVTSKTLGLEARLGGRDGQFSRLIPKDSSIPARVTNEYTTVHDNQEVVEIPVYQGESQIAAENEFLGEFNLVGIPPAPAGQMTIEVTFELDENGILNVSARNPEGGVEDSVTIESGIGLSEREVDRMRRGLPPVK